MIQNLYGVHEVQLASSGEFQPGYKYEYSLLLGAL